ncbi:INTS2 [Lepeophtheirus salmonis]|uniref:INTS2 n=1 Tax=Lepeophtheirus salmonis TaxID=72036 RepID=A0A7R8CMG2_LEPSM|nr:INTS2 [Lepeophtheirus salmonis]CAF2837363.1 INTS2 [Lepeophtheirus salmonis]
MEELTDEGVPLVKREIFEAMLTVDVDSLERNQKDLRPVLASLVRMSLISSADAAANDDYKKTRVLRVLSEMTEIKKEQALKAKGAIPTADSTMDFERSDATGRLRLICDVLCIALAELPHLLSAPEIAESLLKLKYGPCIITHIVANQPDCFGDVAHHLLKNGEKQEEDPNRTKALLYLCRMNPSQTLTIRSQCTEYCRLPGFGCYAYSRRFKCSFLDISIYTNQKKKYCTCRLKKSSSSKSKGINRFWSKNYTKFGSGIILATFIYCFTRHWRLKIYRRRNEHVMDLITIKVPIIPAGFKFVTLGLCMIIACNFLIGTPALESRAIAWLRWLVDDFDFQQFSELACTTLGMKIAIRNNNMTRIKHIFTQEVFTENVVAAHAIKVPVTDKLSCNNSGFLPVHCIHQLLKSRAFSKNKVPIKDWIYRQICASKTPLHPVMPSLIEVYVNSILVPASNRGTPSSNTPSVSGNLVDQTNEPISEQEVAQVFKSLKTTPGDDAFTSTSLAPQMLMLYYILLYDGVRLSYMKSIIASNRRILRYSQKLLSELPLKFLLRTAENKQNMFGGLFPQLLRLCSTHYPHLCAVNDWLENDESLQLSTSVSVSDPKSLTENDIIEAFSEIKVSPVKATLVLQRLLELSTRALWPFAEICIKQIQLLLEPGVPRQVLNLFRKLWFKFNSIFPRKLWVYTINSMRTDIDQIKLDVLVFDPLHVLRVSKRVFCIAPLLEILIYILRAALAASLSNDQEREELKMALIITQESAAIQILLEAALLKSTKEEDGITGLKEIQCIVCSYLHEAFISDPHLAKLVHFQGYPLQLSFPQPNLEKQVFAVDLISHLSIQYALPKSYSTARLAINVLSTLISVITVEERRSLMPPVLPSFVRICKAFPPLMDDAVSLLLQYARISLNEASMNRHYVSGEEEEEDSINGMGIPPLEDHNKKPSLEDKIVALRDIMDYSERDKPEEKIEGNDDEEEEPLLVKESGEQNNNTCNDSPSHNTPLEENAEPSEPLLSSSCSSPESSSVLQEQQILNSTSSSPTQNNFIAPPSHPEDEDHEEGDRDHKVIEEEVDQQESEIIKESDPDHDNEELLPSSKEQQYNGERSSNDSNSRISSPKESILLEQQEQEEVDGTLSECLLEDSSKMVQVEQTASPQQQQALEKQISLEEPPIIHDPTPPPPIGANDPQIYSPMHSHHPQQDPYNSFSRPSPEEEICGGGAGSGANRHYSNNNFNNTTLNNGGGGYSSSPNAGGGPYPPPPPPPPLSSIHPHQRPFQHPSFQHPLTAQRGEADIFIDEEHEDAGREEIDGKELSEYFGGIGDTDNDEDRLVIAEEEFKKDGGNEYTEEDKSDFSPRDESSSTKPLLQDKRINNSSCCFNGISEEDISKKLLPDLIRNDLDILIVGVNPGIYAALKGHHYFGPSNHFWKCMLLSGIGFTNIVQRSTRRSSHLTRKEIEDGIHTLNEKIRKYSPKIAVFNERIRGTDTFIWVMPNSSSRCAQLPSAIDKVPFYASLKKYKDYVKGLIHDVNEEEFVFKDVKIKNYDSPLNELNCNNTNTSTNHLHQHSSTNSTSNSPQMPPNHNSYMNNSHYPSPLPPTHHIHHPQAVQPSSHSSEYE